jgi:Flp pilus assembly protein TadG
MDRIERARRTRHRPTVDSQPGQPGARDGRHPAKPRMGTRGRRDGQSLVEFAVVLPVFLLILAGILDFGLGLYSQMTIINASREGARLGVVEPGNVAAVDARVRAMTTGLDQAQLTINITCERPSGSSFVSCGSPQWQSGDAVVVQVNYDYRMLWPLALGNSLDLSSTVQMRIE